MKVAVVALRDADYINIDPRAAINEDNELLLLTLPCKELENLLVMTPKTVADAAKKAADARATATGLEVPAPSLEEVERKLGEITQTPDVRAAIEDQWLFRWGELNGGFPDPGRLTEAKRQFETRWNDFSWRRRCCPGKLILTYVRRWLQAEPWKLTLTLPQLFAVLEPDPELQSLFDKLEQYVARVTA